MGKHHATIDDYIVSRVRALESILLERGILAPDAVDKVIAQYESDTGPLMGSRAVARAWVDPAFKERLLAEPNRTLKDEMGVQIENLVIVENTQQVHNLVVCTLCSCYPWAVMGMAPGWYKEPAYRSRAVIEPRSVLREFGFDLPADRDIHVWDSSADLRYMVMPMRPEGTGGWSEEQLVPLVTRDSLIGVTEAALPG